MIDPDFDWDELEGEINAFEDTRVAPLPEEPFLVPPVGVFEVGSLPGATLKKDPFAIDLGFKSFSERIQTEREERLANAKNILSFGVPYLDKALGGIFPNDLILLGAKTSVGKSQLAVIIAQGNAKKGKRVHYFALEAEDKEIERRMKWMSLSFILRQRGNGVDMRRLNYMDWYQGKLEDICAPYEKEVDEYVSKIFKTMFTFYRARDFTAKDWEKSVLAVQSETDLIILDHLHYVDSDGETNENAAVKAIVKRIRDVALDIGKPVVVVAHVRKGDRRVKQLVPDVEDFHGSSDISKIATKAIMLAPAHLEDGESNHLWPTYMRVIKCRPDGSRTRYLGLTKFDSRTSNYSEQFELLRLSPSGEETEAVLDDKAPYWASSLAPSKSAAPVAVKIAPPPAHWSDLPEEDEEEN